MPTPSSPSTLPSFVGERRRRPKQKRSSRRQKPAARELSERLEDVSVSQLPVPASLDDRIEEGSLVFPEQKRAPIAFEDISGVDAPAADAPPKRKKRVKKGAPKKAKLAKSNPPFTPTPANEPRRVQNLDVTPMPEAEDQTAAPRARNRKISVDIGPEESAYEDDASEMMDASEVAAPSPVPPRAPSKKGASSKKGGRKKAKKSADAKGEVPKKAKGKKSESGRDAKTRVHELGESASNWIANLVSGDGARARSSNVPLEVLGVTLLASGALSLLALVSMNAADTVGGRAPGPVSNWIGPFGANVAELLTTFFGLAAFGVPFVAFAIAIACFRRKFLRPRAHQVVGTLVGAAGVVTLADVIFAQTDWLSYPAGGVLGVTLSQGLSAYVHALGTGVVAFVAATVGILLAFDRSIGHVLRSALVLMHRGIDWAKEQLELYREQQRLLDEERDRLLDEVAEERAQRRAARKESDAERKQRLRERAEVRARALLDDTNIMQAEAARLMVAAKAASSTVAPSDHAQSVIDQDLVEAVANLRPVPAKTAKDPAWTKAGVDPASLDLDASMQLGALPGVKIRAPIDEGERLSHAQRAAEAKDAADTQESPAPGALVSAETTIAKAKPAAKPSPTNDDEEFRIVERDVDAQAKNLDDDEVTVEDEYELPPLKLLDYDAPQVKPVDPEVARAEAAKLVKTFGDFGIEGRVREIRPGPIVTTYEFVPAPGIKVSRIAALSDDIAMAMEAVHVRIVAPIPGKGAVGIEIPNEKRETVFLKEVIADERFKKSKENKLQMAIGKDIEGRAYHANLGEMPHVLISGTTGSGKSVSVNAMICSILYRATPDEVKFLMIDPKMLELSIYDGIPHLLLPPIIDTTKAANALRWTVEEMERRYQMMSDMGVRDVAGYNQALLDIKDKKHEQLDKIPLDDKGKPYQKLPYIVVIIDEYADLLQTAGKEVEGFVMRLAQKARAAGIHVMLATQRPSVDVITGVIKANFPVRMGFRLASNHDSKTIINRPGAEKLLGRGDMLILPAGTSEVTRVHGAYISEKELHRVIEHIKKQGKPNYDMSITAPPPNEGGGKDGAGTDEALDPKWDDAIAVVSESRRCSTSWIQRKLGIGYNRAARIVERMEQEGLVGPQLNSKGDRDIHLP